MQRVYEAGTMAGVYDEWGIAHGYHDVDGNWHDTPPATHAHLRAAIDRPVHTEPLWFVDQGSTPTLMGRCRLTLEDGSDWGEVDALPHDLPIGYHRLAPVDGGPVTELVVAPITCPPAPRGWGVAAQIYSLYRSDGWGIGDLRDVQDLGREVATRGGTAVLLSPLHAPAPSQPQEDSPYYPSSRRWLNPLLIPLDGPSPMANEPGGLIDRSRVWSAKRAALAQEFSRLPAVSADEWSRWAHEQGDELLRFCTWNALAERLGARWQEWPAEYRDPGADAVRELPLRDPAFAAARDFHAWMQWRAAQSLAQTADAAQVGLIGDLAVGCSPAGADAWLHQDLMALDVRIGAPPDPFNAAGQEWGLPPFVPSLLRAAHYRPFIGMVRAACRSMAGLRIDHVMGLFRQFWIPEGGSPADGAYVQLPSADLLAIIRLEATRAGVYVVGEDLGTVEPEVHHALRASGILGTKVWWFDPHPQDWSPANLATVTTHDLPTVAGVLAGTDGTPEMAASLQQFAGAEDDPAVAVHHAVAQSQAALCLAAMDDLAGCTDRPNHPGTLSDEHPNWCRRLSATSPEILSAPLGNAVLAAVASEHRSGPPGPRSS